MESLPKELGTYKVVLEYNSLNAELFFDIEQKDNFPIAFIIALCFIGVAIIVSIVWFFVKRKNKIKK